MMNQFRIVILTGLLLGSSVTAVAETRELQNKVTAYIEQGATAKDAVISIWMENVNPVVGVTLPFKFAPGSDVMALDSLHTSMGCAAHFFQSQPVYDKDKQTLLVNLLLRPDQNKDAADPIPTGSCLVARLFFSGDKDLPLKDLRMVAATLPPHNKLMYVISTANTVLPDFEVVNGEAPSWPPKKESGKTP